MQYLINYEFGDNAGHVQYVGTREELLRNIRSTWSKIPHKLEESSMKIKVIGEQPAKLLAVFKLVDFNALPLPGHF